jgi:hypothetical protein
MEMHRASIVQVHTQGLSAMSTHACWGSCAVFFQLCCIEKLFHAFYVCYTMYCHILVAKPCMGSPLGALDDPLPEASVIAITIMSYSTGIVVNRSPACAVD